MKENYELKGVARRNPYAKKMKNGYSVAIHYDTREDMEENTAIDTIRSLLKQPKLNSIHLYIKNNANKSKVTMSE
ncbi:MAG: hypothetical protein FWH05_07855 [Oscillospiraceae bacterium]|nr:hypothetical protein [Oscillospiraceae bacterium]